MDPQQLKRTGSPLNPVSLKQLLDKVSHYLSLEDTMYTTKKGKVQYQYMKHQSTGRITQLLQQRNIIKLLQHKKNTYTICMIQSSFRIIYNFPITMTSNYKCNNQKWLSHGTHTQTINCRNVTPDSIYMFLKWTPGPIYVSIYDTRFNIGVKMLHLIQSAQPQPQSHP